MSKLKTNLSLVLLAIILFSSLFVALGTKSLAFAQTAEATPNTTYALLCHCKAKCRSNLFSN